MQYIPQSCRKGREREKKRNNVYQLHSNYTTAHQTHIGIFHVMSRYHVMLPENSLKNSTVGPSPESIVQMFTYSDILSLRSKVLSNFYSLS